MNQKVRDARYLLVAIRDILAAKKGQELNQELNLGHRFMAVTKPDRMALVMLEALEKTTDGRLSVQEMGRVQGRLSALLQGFPWENEDWTFVVTAPIVADEERGDYRIKVGPYPLHALGKTHYLALVALTALMAEYADASKDEVLASLVALGWWFSEDRMANRAVDDWKVGADEKDVPAREGKPHAPTPWRVTETNGQMGIMDAEGKLVMKANSVSEKWDRDNLEFIVQTVNNRRAYEGLEDAVEALMVTSPQDEKVALRHFIAMGEARNRIRELRQHSEA